jgi:hypothetical protein
MRPCLTETLRSFVFIDILALFRRKAAFSRQLSALSRTIGAGADPACLGSAMSRRDKSGHSALFDRTAPSAHRRRSKTTSARAHDFFTRSFVFIDILALFRQFSSSGRCYS